MKKRIKALFVVFALFLNVAILQIAGQPVSADAQETHKTVSFYSGQVEEAPYLFTWACQYHNAEDGTGAWMMETYPSEANRSIIYIFDFPDDAANVQYTPKISGNYGIYTSSDLKNWTLRKTEMDSNWGYWNVTVSLDEELGLNPENRVFVKISGRYADTFPHVPGPARLSRTTLNYDSPTGADMDNSAISTEYTGTRATNPSKFQNEDVYDSPLIDMARFDDDNFVVEKVGSNIDSLKAAYGNTCWFIEDKEDDEWRSITLKFQLTAGTDKALLYLNMCSSYHVEVSPDQSDWTVAGASSYIGVFRREEAVFDISASQIGVDGAFYVRLHDSINGNGDGMRLYGYGAIAVQADSTRQHVSVGAGTEEEAPYMLSWSGSFDNTITPAGDLQFNQYNDGGVWAPESYINGVYQNLTYILDFPDDAESAFYSPYIGSNYAIYASTDLDKWDLIALSYEDIHARKINLPISQYLGCNPENRVYIKVADTAQYDTSIPEWNNRHRVARLAKTEIDYISASGAPMDNDVDSTDYIGTRVGYPGNFNNNARDNNEYKFIQRFNESGYIADSNTLSDEGNKSYWIIGTSDSRTYEFNLTPGMKSATVYLGLVGSYKVEVSKDDSTWHAGKLSLNLGALNDFFYERNDVAVTVGSADIALDGTLYVRVSCPISQTRLYSVAIVGSPVPVTDISWMCGSVEEAPYMFTWNAGFYNDAGSNRGWTPQTYANYCPDRSLTYVLDYPNDTVSASYILTLYGNYRVQVSADLKVWTELKNEFISNFSDVSIGLTPYLENNPEKIVFVKVTDRYTSQTISGPCYVQRAKTLYSSLSDAPMDNLGGSRSYKGTRMFAPLPSENSLMRDCDMIHEFDESDYLFDDNDTENDNYDNRVIRTNQSATYRFNLASSAKATLYLTVGNTYTIEVSKDNENWTVLDTNTVHDDNSFFDLALDIDEEFIAEDGTFYIKLYGSTQYMKLFNIAVYGDTVVYGDVTGDRAVDAADITAMKKHVLELNILSEGKQKAGRVAGNDYLVSVNDIVAVKRSMVGLEVLQAG